MKALFILSCVLAAATIILAGMASLGFSDVYLFDVVEGLLTIVVFLSAGLFCLAGIIGMVFVFFYSPFLVLLLPFSWLKPVRAFLREYKISPFRWLFWDCPRYYLLCGGCLANFSAAMNILHEDAYQHDSLATITGDVYGEFVGGVWLTNTLFALGIALTYLSLSLLVKGRTSLALLVPEEFESSFLDALNQIEGESVRRSQGDMPARGERFKIWKECSHEILAAHRHYLKAVMAVPFVWAKEAIMRTT